MSTISEASAVGEYGDPRQARELFLSEYEKEHATTARVLRAYPTDRLELRPAPECRSARELGWTFVMEKMLGQMVLADVFVEKASGAMPTAPESWEEILQAFEKGHRDYGNLIRSLSDEELYGGVRFFTGPGQIGTYSRIEWMWFLHHDEIHHRGQFSVYLRMAGGKVPSIYGPSKDEPWV